MLNHLMQQLTQHAIPANEQQIDQLSRYIELLKKWNRVYNLIATDQTRHIIDRHIIDSLLVIPYLHGKHILDVGTGAGLPGIPLAILLPEKNFVLLDSNGKKTRFITQVKVSLGLDNVQIINQRVEIYQPEILFDVVISRAFANLTDMLNLTQHLCAEEGEFISLKGESVNTELALLSSPFECAKVERLPYLDQTIQRKIVIIKRNLRHYL